MRNFNKFKRQLKKRYFIFLFGSSCFLRAVSPKDKMKMLIIEFAAKVTNHAN